MNIMDGPDSWKIPFFWRKLFIYFWIFSLLGHYFEVVGAYLIHFIVNNALWHPETMTTIPLAVPYGIGAVASILLVGDLARSRKLNFIEVFIVNTVICSVIEYTCAAILINFYGHNKYWDYSDSFMNLDGYICLEASLVFGILSTIFIYFIYPATENIFKKISKGQADALFWSMLIAYSIDLVDSYIK
ncbi:MAG: putative ABC transporter permease [Candidatus Saccharimonadaceae bacterium]|nr:putative ABC transporter permease [Candidatus Saccharimonadaceae bacterium]